MVKAIFFDIDVIFSTDAKAWIVDRKNPSIPIMKISKSDFNLYQNGIFRKQGNKIEFNGKTFWLPNDVINNLKVKVKNHKSNFADLAISLQEFMNKNIIENLEFDINTQLLSKFKNTSNDIYIICSKQTKLSHQSIIDKVEEKLKEEGLEIKNFYFISETFYNQNQDEVEFKKMRLLIQHLVGYKTSGNKFIDEEITRYDQVEYFDNNLDTIKVNNQTNDLLKVIWENSDEGLKSVIKEDITQYKPQLIVNQVNDNSVNQISSEKINLSISNLIKTFEGFGFMESIEFKKQPSKGKTEKYKVEKDKKEIGEVKWSSRMRGYAFLPPSDSEKEIKEFTSKLMSKWRKDRKKVTESALSKDLEEYYSNIESIEDFLLELKDGGDEVKVHGEPGEKLNPGRRGPNQYIVEIESTKSDIDERINWSRIESKFKIVKKQLRKLKLIGRNNVLEIVLTEK